MFSPSIHVPWLAVLVSSVALQALGAFWFMAVIPRAYARALGRDDLAGRKPEPLFIAGPFVCNLVVVIANAVLLRSLAITALSSALELGALVGVGLLVPTVANVAINPNIPRPLLYGLINAPYFVLVGLVSCAILTAMGG